MKVRRARLASRVKLIRGDIRHLPFPDKSFELVMAPYGILQSLLDEKLLSATLKDVRRVHEARWHLRPPARRRSARVGGVFESPEPARRRGPNGKPIALIQSVKQDRRNHITRFEQEFVEGRGKSATRKKFRIAFRTLSVPQMAQRLEKAGFEVAALLGDYQGGPWDLRADVWIILARPTAALRSSSGLDFPCATEPPMRH